MTNNKELIEMARRAEGSEVLPRVRLGMKKADELLLAMVDALEATTAEQCVEVKPLVFARITKHAFLSGFVAAKNLPAHGPI